jgi:pilus assembly protein Flp/PilA
MSGFIELSKSAARSLRVYSKRGVTSIEYGLLAALISIVIIGGVTTMGTRLNGVFKTLAAQLPVATNGPDIPNGPGSQRP